ncbi:ABC transporter permease [Paralimibaculum aggregatum]|uniref:ABC transporter permease n=1 Tax=Paralimibaculum aggregatum TaxID=3036245 RepID=A0ABQ6LR78_9RHOB|nr:ABC transporter permease [Limibaculum sp. NKW23]GMG84832.1 ABC transporter permease [Limibaculum sp. NKW23]
MERADRRRELVGWLLVAPSLLFMAFFFAVPIGAFLLRSVDNTDLVGAMPRTMAEIGGWNGQDLPDESLFMALGEDFTALPDITAAASLGRRLNHNLTGYRSLVMRTFTGLRRHEGPLGREALIAIDKRWSDPAHWRVIQQERSWLTPLYLLASLDLERGPEGIRTIPPERRLFVDLLVRTAWISIAVTLLCLVLGFPLAYVMASSGPRLSSWMLVLVLLPFWTSLLVRTTAWIVLLQRNGLVNQVLERLGLIDAPLTLIYNRLGVYIAMTHVLLPFLVLPLYSVMKGVGGDLTRAAAGLGAPPSTVFRRVYLPQVMPGIIAGCSLVFVLALGYYITPALVGGPRDQMIAHFIAYFTSTSVNWGMAASLAGILLLMVVVLYAALARLVGLDRLKAR